MRNRNKMFRNLKKEVGSFGSDRIKSRDEAEGESSSMLLGSMIIPIDPEAFYLDFGFLHHPRTGEQVLKLAEYQLNVWKASLEHRRVLVIKSNKIGLTTSVLMGVFQRAVLPAGYETSCRGFDILIIAQTTLLARDHIRTLVKMIAASEKYSKFLITNPRKKLLKSEATKASVIYIQNPDNENQPTRILGLGINNAGSLMSWKNVKYIHISDAAAANCDITESINGAMTRLANTDGGMIIETIPSGPAGRIYELYLQSKEFTGDDGKDNTLAAGRAGIFKLFEIPASEAVKAGVIKQDFLDEEKGRQGSLFPQYYEAKFVTLGGAIFSPSQVDHCIRSYSFATEEGSQRIMAVDWGFGSSKTAIIGIERRRDGKLYVIECRELDRPTVSAVNDLIVSMFYRGGYSRCYADGSQPGIINDLLIGSEKANRPPIEAHPVKFGKELSEMLAATIKLVREGEVVIHSEFASLLQQLKTVQHDKKGNPDKSNQSLDLFDAFMMAVSHADAGEFHFEHIGNIHGEDRPFVVPALVGRKLHDADDDDDNHVEATKSERSRGGLKLAAECEICGKNVKVQLDGNEPSNPWTGPVYCSDHLNN